ncbi:hypothetical protein B5N75_12270 [Salmonella enterica]|nr:hypothetical protein [Salmonella enterica]EAM3005023.1 hypothetical protein [Salmonella enterica]EAO9965983.1 hypothetical protein [Salmonella enterica]
MYRGRPPGAPAGKEPVQYQQLTVELSCEGTHRPLQNAGYLRLWRGDSVSVAPSAAPLTPLSAMPGVRYHQHSLRTYH